MSSLSSRDGLKIGSTFALAWQLLRAHGVKIIWLYVVCLLVPGVILGELGDTPSDALFSLFNNERLVTLSGGLAPFGYLYQFPVTLFMAFALATLVRAPERPWRGALRAYLTIFLLLLAPFAFNMLAGKIWPALPSMVMNFALQLLFWLLMVCVSLFTFVAPAVATSAANPAQAISQSIALVWPHWFRTLIFVACIAGLGVVSEYAEQWLLTTYTTPDGSLLDWSTTVIQEMIRSGYFIFSTALVAATYLLLVRAREGPPAIETAAVFD